MKDSSKLKKIIDAAKFFFNHFEEIKKLVEILPDLTQCLDISAQLVENVKFITQYGEMVSAKELATTERELIKSDAHLSNGERLKAITDRIQDLDSERMSWDMLQAIGSQEIIAKSQALIGINKELTKLNEALREIEANDSQQ